MSDKAIRALLSALLVISAALFAIGVVVQRHARRDERRQAAHATSSGVVLVAYADQGRGERHLGNPESSRARPAERHVSNEPAASPAGETRAERRTETGGAAGHESAAQLARERGSERVFGINTESTALVTIAVAVSLAFALTLWLRPSVLVALGIAGFALAAAAFDVREVLQQIDESRTNVAAIAALVALLHAAAAAVAVVLARRPRLPAA